MKTTITVDDRKDVESLIETIESEGWVVTDYRVKSGTPVKAPQLGVEIEAYKK